jgi:hypothetical protein
LYAKINKFRCADLVWTYGGEEGGPRADLVPERTTIVQTVRIPSGREREKDNASFVP